MKKKINRRSAAALQFLFGVCGLLFSIISGFLFVPLYLEYFNEDAYGAWLAAAGMLLMISIVDPGVGIVTTQRLSRFFGQQDSKSFARDAGTALVLGAATGVLVFLACLPLALFGPQLFGCPEQYQRGMRIGLLLFSVATGLGTFKYCIGSIPSTLQRPTFPGIALISAQATGIILTYVSLKSGWGIVSLGIGQITIEIVLLIFYLIYVPRLWRSFELPRPSFEFRIVREYVRTSAYLLVSKITNLAGRQLDAPVAALWVSPAAAVIFNQTAKFAQIVPIFIDRIGSAVFAGIGIESGRQEQNLKSIFSELLLLVSVLGTCGLSFAFLFTEPLIELWIKKDLFGGLWLLAAIVTGAGARIIRQTLASNLMGYGLIPEVSKIQMWESPVKIGSMLLLVPFTGLMGIAGANLIAVTVTSVPIIILYIRTSGLSLTELAQIALPCVAVNLLLVVGYHMFLGVPDSWTELFIQAITLGILQVLIFLAFHGRFRRVVKRNLLLLKKR